MDRQRLAVRSVWLSEDRRVHIASRRAAWRESYTCNKVTQIRKDNSKTVYHWHSRVSVIERILKPDSYHKRAIDTMVDSGLADGICIEIQPGLSFTLDHTLHTH